jgi:NAD(P)H-dependent flavin oxidoreductase YrpB (nitropropane dioxygenase family)
LRSPVCDLLGIDFPLLAFSHCRDVVAAVTNAGGFGVLGASSHSPAQLDIELDWIDQHTGGRPYGADILVPGKVVGKGEHLSTTDLAAMVPAEHQEFVAKLLSSHGVQVEKESIVVPEAGRLGTPDAAEELMDVAFAHPIKLIANALGPPPASMSERAKREGVPVAALIGAKGHAERQLNAGVDMLIAQGSEAGGHTGSVSTLVLVPEVLEVVGDRVPVLAAGGIINGAQMAAMMALGAAGVWTGSVWLTTEEAETAPATKAKFLAATASDTVRSRGRTGKPARQLRSAWTDAWEPGAGGPTPLPMPLQSIISEPALHRVDAAAASGNAAATELATYFVGQGVGLLNAVKPTARVVQEFMEDFAAAAERLQGLLD